MIARLPTARRQHWPPGHQIVLRHVLRGRLWGRLPVTVLADRDDLAVLRVTAGTEWSRATMPNGRVAHSYQRRWRLAPARWYGHDISMAVPVGRHYSVGVVRDAHTSAIVKFYVNLQEPMRRTQWGFDTMDLELDLEIDPDNGRSRWKDVDRFHRLVEQGLISTRKRSTVWRQGREALTLAPTLIAEINRLSTMSATAVELRSARVDRDSP